MALTWDRGAETTREPAAPREDTTPPTRGLFGEAGTRECPPSQNPNSFSRPLELKTRSKLHSAVVAGGVGPGPETAVSREDVRKGKALMISHVEHLCADLNQHAFSNGEIFRE